MSTLNALGFNVRRKRNNDFVEATKQQQQQGKNIINKGNLTTPSLAFASEPLIKEEESLSYNRKTLQPQQPQQQQQQSSFKLKQTSISKYTRKTTTNNNNSNNNSNKCNQNNKVPKQSNILQFLSTTSSKQLNTELTTINNNNDSSSIMIDNNNNNTLVHLNDKKEYSMEEDSYHYSIRHPITISEVFPLLIDSFGIYDNNNNNNNNNQNGDNNISTLSSPLILEVKPNKKILSSTINELNINNETIITKGIRRNRQYDDDNDENEERYSNDILKEFNEEEDDDDSDDTTGSDLSLPSAFTKSMTFYPMKKRYCSNQTTKNGTTTTNNLFSDLKEDYTQNDEGLYEKRELKHHLTIDQVNTLLLDIANEFLAFENNEW